VFSALAVGDSPERVEAEVLLLEVVRFILMTRPRHSGRVGPADGPLGDAIARFHGLAPLAWNVLATTPGDWRPRDEGT
jgi:hypothetical protein